MLRAKLIGSGKNELIKLLPPNHVLRWSDLVEVPG